MVPLSLPGATTALQGVSHHAGGEKHTLSRPAGTLSREAGEGKAPTPPGAIAHTCRGGEQAPRLTTENHPARGNNTFHVKHTPQGRLLTRVLVYSNTCPGG